MKIRVAILDNDVNYLSRISDVFHTKYAERIELYSFTDCETAVEALASTRIHVFLASDLFDVECARLPEKCGFAYFVESGGIEMIRGRKAVCKFQKADVIYQQILSIYSDCSEGISGTGFRETDGKRIAFLSPVGGSGSSTMAAACALHFARQGKKVFYLNLEKFGSADLFFSGDGSFNLSDVIFALKNKKANMETRLESCMKLDEGGVAFFSHPKVALDAMELRADEIRRLLIGLQTVDDYEYIVLDMDFAIDADMLELYSMMQSIVMVGDGSEISNWKISRAYQTFFVLEQVMDTILTDHIVTIYNRFNSTYCKLISGDGPQNIGGAPRYRNVSVRQMVRQLSSMEMFDHIV